MEHMFKKFLSIAALLSVGVAVASCDNDCDNECQSNRVITCLTPRSTSFNNVIKTAGLDPYAEYQDDMDNCNGNLSIALEYSQTFRDNRLGKCLFGPAAIDGDCDNSCDDNNVLVRVKGSLREPNGTSDLVADNFFLPRNYESTVSFSPSIKNVNVHFQFYAGLDEWANGLYFRLYAPVTYSRWELDANEILVNEGTTGFDAGVIAPAAVNASSLQKSFLSYARGGAVTIDGVTVQPLKASRICCDTLTETKLADLRAELGWNFCMNEDYHVGFYVEAAAPTGNECCGECLWSPVVGNGKFWELGGGMTAHYTLWRGCDDDKQFDLYFEGDVTHMFQHEVERTFDLKDKPLSRYMIAEQMTSTISDGLVVGSAEGNAPSAQFNKVYAPVANFTTRNVDVSVAAQGEVTLKFVYTCNGFSWELGYDFYGRSCEKLEFDCDCNTFNDKLWALRGDAQVYGFSNIEESSTPVALGASRNSASAFSLTGAGNTANTFANGTGANNNQVNNPAQAFTAAGPLRGTPTDTASTISTSNPPVFITQADLDLVGTRLISNKIFTDFTYTWIDREDWVPFVNLGASVEFGSTHNSGDCDNDCDTSCNTSCDDDCNTSCVTCTPSQWAVWIKGGLTFN